MGKIYSGDDERDRTWERGKAEWVSERPRLMGMAGAESHTFIWQFRIFLHTKVKEVRDGEDHGI